MSLCSSAKSTDVSRSERSQSGNTQEGDLPCSPTLKIPPRRQLQGVSAQNTVTALTTSDPEPPELSVTCCNLFYPEYIGSTLLRIVVADLPRPALRYRNTRKYVYATRFSADIHSADLIQICSLQVQSAIPSHNRRYFSESRDAASTACSCVCAVL